MTDCKNNDKSIDCKEVGSQVLLYLDKECDQETRVEIEKHLELCRSCFDVAEFEQLLRDHMRKKTNHCCPDKVKKKIQDLLDRF